MTDALQSASRIYLDANVLIYFVEDTGELGARIGEIIDNAIQHDKHLVISEVAIAECLYGAFKRRSSELAETYREMFYDIALFELAPINGERVIAAAKIGAEKGLKLVDAIHFSTALETKCSVFVTNDGRFRSSHGLYVHQIGQT